MSNHFLRLPMCVLLLSVLNGCSPASSPARSVAVSPAAQNTPASSLPAASSVHTRPLYKQAERACRAKHYRAAADLLLRLTVEPGLSPADQAFIGEQRDICLQDAGLPVARRVPVPAASVRTAPASRPGLTPEQADCGPRALALVCKSLDVPATLPQLRLAAGTTGNGTTLQGLAKAAEATGLKAEGVQVSREALPLVQTPAVAWVNQHHYIAVLQLHGTGEQAMAVVHDPNTVAEETMSQERLLRLSGGILLSVHR